MASRVGEVADALEAKSAAFVKEHRPPGAAVGIVHGDQLAWSAGVGFADVASRAAPTGHTLYRIASITKTFTGTAILQLRDEGRLHLDDPAVDHLPELRAAPSPFGRIETVTIRRLRSHGSGLASDPPGTDRTVPAYEGVVERNLERVTEIGTLVPPSTQQKYSNLGYQLLGEIVARVSGTPYPEYVRRELLQPLGPAPMPETYRAPLGVYLNPDEGVLWRLEWRDGTLTYLDPSDPTSHEAHVRLDPVGDA